MQNNYVYLNLRILGKKQPIALPSRKILRTTLAPAQYSPQSSQSIVTGPVPPTRTTSKKPTHEVL